MARNLFFVILIATSSFAVQNSCTAKASDCKDPVGNPRHYQDNCMCFTCEKGTSHEKVVCTKDENEAGKLQARVDNPNWGIQEEKREAKAAAKSKDMRLTGWIKDDNGKTVFVSDKDKQSWEIANPDVVQAHEGRRVKVRAKIDDANQKITIDQLTMMRPKNSETSQKREKKD